MVSKSVARRLAVQELTEIPGQLILPLDFGEVSDPYEDADPSELEDCE